MAEPLIRVCKTWDECVQCEELQRRIWEMPDYRDVVPANLLITAAKNGGILLGAFKGSEMVGFAFGFLGREPAAGDAPVPGLKHTSHMLGVLPGARAHGVGTALKWAQRAEAQKQGLDLMTWTYDPLQAINAHLNLNRLGGIVRRYIQNAYGEMTDALNAGLGSDRFQVEWYLESPRVIARAQNKPLKNIPPFAAPVFRVEWTAAGFPRIVEELPWQANVLVEIPSDIHAVKTYDMSLAEEWRQHTRRALERAFAEGLAATALVRDRDRQGNLRTRYLLEKLDAV